MTSSLVGSEMCIRDRAPPTLPTTFTISEEEWEWRGNWFIRHHRRPRRRTCLLYTSDAADDM
eukprot:8488958-Prorocentrum_lima.AAC.1